MSLPRLLACWAFFFLLTGAAMAVEEPGYQVLRADGDFEVRLYPQLLIAETEAEGDMDQASNQGFRAIADFIFGNNQSPATQKQDKIAMTAPVTVEPRPAKIAMTAPVSVQPESSATDMQEARRWRIEFVMPSNYTLESIPKPNNPLVTLRVVPARQVLVHKYSGFNTLSRVQSKTEETLQWARQHDLQVIGPPRLARYDPPWTLPMFRRNEIVFELAKP
jgi:hypothetical protein